MKHGQTITYQYVFTVTRKNKNKPDKTYYFLRHPGIPLVTGSAGDDKPKTTISFPAMLKPGTDAFEDFRREWVSKCERALTLGNESPSFQPGTVGHLINIYKGDEELNIQPNSFWTELKDATVRNYLPILKDINLRWGEYKVNLLDSEMTARLRNTIKERSGPITANHYLAVLKNLEKVAMEHRTTFGLEASFSFATGVRRYGKRSGIKPRDQWWTYDEEIRFLRVAINGETAGSQPIEPDIMVARGYALLAYTGQRLKDVLEMTLEQFDGTHIDVTQNKTSARIRVKVHEDLRPVLLAAQKDARDAGRIKTTIIHDQDWQPMKGRYFASRWDVIARSIGIYGRLQRRDLRRTAVVRLDQAGATTGEIASITGHSEASISSIIDVYRVRTTETASNAILKLEAFTQGQKRIANENKA